MGGLTGKVAMIYFESEEKSMDGGCPEAICNPSTVAHSSSVNLEANIMYVYGGSNAEKNVPIW